VNREPGTERGSVTAELATGLVGLVLVLGAVLGTGAVAVGQLRCVDAARAGARSAARGEEPAEVVAVARRLAGAAAQVSTSRSGDLVRVDVRSTVRLPLPGSPSVVLDATAAVPVEVVAGEAPTGRVRP
jgi:hypothetical protein